MDGTFPNLDAAKEAAGISLAHFYAYMPMHNYIYAPGRAHWPGASVNSRLPAVPVLDQNGDPLLDDKGKPKLIAPTQWLDKHQPVEQMTWAPGLPMVIEDKLILDGVTCLRLFGPCEAGIFHL